MVLLLPICLIFLLKRNVYDRRRKFERFSVTWQTNISSSIFHLLKGEIYSFSLGGLAFCCTDSLSKALKKNDKVSLLVEDTKLEGYVCWSSKETHSIGLEFTPQSRAKAENFLDNIDIYNQ